MRRALVAIAIVGGVWMAAESRISGQSANASLNVNATVAKNCTITTAPVTFGAYDPVVANATANLDATGTVTVACTKNAVAKIGLGVGSNAQGASRRMNQSTSFLNYELYKESTRTTVWGDTALTGLDVPAAPNKNPRPFTVYGRVAGNQDVTVGTYTDTVVATVNF